MDKQVLQIDRARLERCCEYGSRITFVLGQPEHFGGALLSLWLRSSLINRSFDNISRVLPKSGMGIGIGIGYPFTVR